MQALQAHWKMRHLLKLCKTHSTCTLLVSSLNCSILKTARCSRSLTTLFKTHNQKQVETLPLVSCRHLNCSSRYFSPVCSSIYQRPSLNEKIQLQKYHIHTTVQLFVSTESNQNSSADNILSEAKSKEYITIYLHNKIRFFRVFCSAAKYSTLMFVTSAPICIAATLGGILSQENSLLIISSLAFYSAIFNTQNYFLMTRILCKVMISTDERFVKISHLTVFGNRHDLYVNPSNIIPISGSLYNKNIHVVRFKKSSKKLFFFPHHGEHNTNFEVLEALFTGGIVTNETEPQK